jgi:predicted ATP-binding protein involved in virulence
LLEKVSNRSYGKYLLKISLARARAFTDKAISFDFPVTALVGPNGGGKTTVLGAAACAYKTVKPSLYFSKSGKFDSESIPVRGTRVRLRNRSIFQQGSTA